MNIFFSTFYNKLNKLNSTFYNELNKLTSTFYNDIIIDYKIMNIIPLIYANLITNMKIIKYSINGYYIYNIYSNRITYGNNILNLLLNSKIKFTKFTNLIYKFYNKLNNNTKDYELKNAELYINLSEKINVTDYFKNNTIISIDDNLICDIYVYFYKKIIDNKDIRLKIYYTYKNKEYILYYSYHRLYNNYNKIEFEIPYPPYTENILNNYRKDIIRPNYVISSNKTLLYSLFNIESKDIDSIILNNYKTNEYNYDKINKYINMIHGPLNDFGILYSCPVKLSWILEENNVEIETFNSLYIRFLNMYFDEEKLDLFEHKIELNRDNIDQILISNRMDYILNEKNKEIIIKNDIRKVIDILS